MAEFILLRISFSKSFPKFESSEIGLKFLISEDPSDFFYWNYLGYFPIFWEIAVIYAIVKDNCEESYVRARKITDKVIRYFIRSS